MVCSPFSIVCRSCIDHHERAVEWRWFLGLFDVVRVSLLQHHVDLGREDVLVKVEVTIVAAMKENER